MKENADFLRVQSSRSLSGKATRARAEIENRVEELQLSEAELLKIIAHNQIEIADLLTQIRQAVIGLIGVIVAVATGLYLYAR